MTGHQNFPPYLRNDQHTFLIDEKRHLVANCGISLVIFVHSPKFRPVQQFVRIVWKVEIDQLRRVAIRHAKSNAPAILRLNAENLKKRLESAPYNNNGRYTNLNDNLLHTTHWPGSEHVATTVFGWISCSDRTVVIETHVPSSRRVKLQLSDRQI